MSQSVNKTRDLCTSFPAIVGNCVEFETIPSQLPNHIRLNSVSSYHKHNRENVSCVGWSAYNR
jgi:hypothetical protein